MIRNICLIVLLLGITNGLAQTPATSDTPTVITLWPEGKMPGTGAALPEKGAITSGFTNVSNPMITVYKATGVQGIAPAIVVCPGGGYEHLAYSKEGVEIAQWLNTLGITGVVLKYRVPKNREGAAQDIQRAVRLVRSNATSLGIDPAHVDVMGFSAGGHLCAWLSTNFATAAYPAIDDADSQSCRPDFTVLVYPAYLDQKGVLAPELPISAQIPPTLIIHNEDDKAYVSGSKTYHAALDEAKVPNEFHLYTTGGHGYGLHSTPDKGVYVWPKDCEAWLVKTGVIPAK